MLRSALVHLFLIIYKIYVDSVITKINTVQHTGHAQNYSVSQKNPPPAVFRHFSSNGWEFLTNVLRTYYVFLSTLEYKFLFNYLQLWRSYAILSKTTYRIFYISLELNF